MSWRSPSPSPSSDSKPRRESIAMTDLGPQPAAQDEQGNVLLRALRRMSKKQCVIFACILVVITIIILRGSSLIVFAYQKAVQPREELPTTTTTEIPIVPIKFESTTKPHHKDSSKPTGDRIGSEMETNHDFRLAKKPLLYDYEYEDEGEQVLKGEFIELLEHVERESYLKVRKNSTLGKNGDSETPRGSEKPFT